MPLPFCSRTLPEKILSPELAEDRRIAYVVSPHGFGHAARSVAVLEALRELRPEIVPQLFTTVPEWFWEDSLGRPYGYHRVLTDVGLVQVSPIEEDPLGTVEALDALRPFVEAAEPLARSIQERRCELVVCDISPLGLAAAKLAGVPSVLVESFTWDWIYESYFDSAPGLRGAASEMAELFEGADLHFQTEPACRPVPTAVQAQPVYRRSRCSATEIRRRLELDERPVVLISMGGISASFGFLDQLAKLPEMQFVAFSGVERLERRDNVVLLPDRSPIPVADLVAAAEVVVGKLGYSTVAEAWGAATRYAYVPRRRFPEGPSLGGFVSRHLPSLEVDPAHFQSGEWLADLPALLDQPVSDARRESGASLIAERLAKMLDGASPQA